MRKSVMIIMAAVLLAAAVAPRGFITAGISGDYGVKFTVNPYPEYEAEPYPEAEAAPESEYEAAPESEYEAAPEAGLEMNFAVTLQPAGQSGLTGGNHTGEAQSEPPEAEASESEASETAESEIGAEAESIPEEYGLEKSEYAFSVLSPHEAVAGSYAELKSALADDNGITTVYFGDNITMQAGIKINPKKADVEIVGLNPLDPASTQPYTLTDIDSVSFYDTVYVSEAGTRTIYIRDLAMIGKNFYGPFSAADISGLSGLVITYERVFYDGPQLAHNRRGTVRFIDSSANIHGGNGIISPHQEFCEAKHLVFEGTSTINNASSTNSVFWHPLGGSFEVADDSSLTLTSPATSATYGVFYADGAANKLDIAVGRRSVLNMTISGVVAPEAYVTVSGLTVHEGGEFRLKTTKSSLAAVLRVGGSLVVEKDATFAIHGAGGSSQYALRQQGGDITVKKDAVFRILAENPYAALLNLAGCGIICDDPSSVLLYNAGRNIAASTGAGRVYADSQQANYWDGAVPDEFDFPPLYGWRKADKSNFVIDAALAAGSNANFSKVESNYAAKDPPGLPPDPETFNMVKSRVLAFGRLELVVSEPAERSDSVGGVTAAGALVRVSFTQGGITYTFPDVRADSSGRFHIPLGVELEAGTAVKVKSRWQYLTEEAEVRVEGNGSLGLFAPDVLEFYTTPLSQFNKTVKRLKPDWKIVVSDTRGTDGKWSVYAKLEHEMLPGKPHLPALSGALVFIDDWGRASALNTDNDILIFEHTPPAGGEALPIVWEEDKGILLEIRPGSVFADTPYSAVICWTIVDGV